MANKIRNKDIDFILSYKAYLKKGKSSPFKKIAITFLCLLIISGLVYVGYICQNKLLKIEDEITVLENYLTDTDNVSNSAKAEELKLLRDDLRKDFNEINQVINKREASVKVDQAVIDEIVSSIGVNDQITGIVYNRATNNLFVDLTFTGEISSFDVIRNLKAKSHFKNVYFNLYRYDENNLVYQMSVTILLTDGKE